MTVEFDCEGCGWHVIDIVGEEVPDPVEMMLVRRLLEPREPEMAKEPLRKPDAPLVIGVDDVARLHRLRAFGAKRPVNIQDLMISIKTPDGEREHRKKMTAQTVVLAHGPWDFFVTFSIETGQPVGTCRHMSMSIKRDGRVPSLAAVWLVAEELGFAGSLETCKVWIEDLTDGGKAVNIVQPIAVHLEPTKQ